MNILVLILCQTLSWRYLNVLSQLSIIHTLCPLVLFSNYPPSWPAICPPPAQRSRGRQDLYTQTPQQVFGHTKALQHICQLLPGKKKKERKNSLLVKEK